MTPDRLIYGFPVFHRPERPSSRQWFALDESGKPFAHAATWHECEDLIYEEISRRWEAKKARGDK